MADLYDFTERLKLLLYGYHGKSKMNTRHFDDNFRSIDQFAKETDKGFSDEEKARENVRSDLLKNITENKKLFDSHTADTIAHLTTDERQSWNDKYTKNEINSKFLVYDKNGNGKVDVAEKAEAVMWGDVTEKPLTFPASSHNHDAYQLKSKKIENVTVETTQFVESTDFSQYLWQADISIADMTPNDFAWVIPNPTSKALLAHDNQTLVGKLRIYAIAKPPSNIVISAIVYERIE